MANPQVIMPDGAIKRQGDSLAPQGVVVSAIGTAGGSILTATPTKVPYNTKDFDPYGWFDTTNNRFLPKLAGYYRVAANWATSDNLTAGNFVIIYIYKNGSVYKRVVGSIGGTGNDQAVHISGLVYLNGTTDYIEIYAYQNSGSTRTFATNAQEMFFDAELVAVSAGVVPEPWHNIHTTGEPQYAPSGAAIYSTSPARFFKDPHGIVHLEIGILTGGSTIAAGTTLFTMPTGYRPGAIVYTAPETAQGNSTWKAYIDTAGLVKHAGGTMSSGGFGYAFPPIQYRAEL